MRRTLLGVCLLATALSVHAGDPAFEKGIKLKAADAEINLKVGHLVPVVTDWNGDKKKDLIVGHFTGRDGNVKLYLNKGTNAAPVLAAGVPVNAGGKPIRMDGG